MEIIERGGEATNGLVGPCPSPRSPLPPSKRIVSSPMEPTPPPYEKKTRDLPNLTNCHRCGARKPSRGHLQLLPSQWRIALLCRGCLNAIASAEACSYCFSQYAAPGGSDNGQLLDCRQCRRRIHRSCLPDHHRSIPTYGFIQDCFVCMDCCPYVRPRVITGSTGSMEDVVRDARAVAEKKAAVAARAKENCVRKAAAATSAAERARSALDSVLAMKVGRDAPVQELALQLHRAMNGLQRNMRSLGSWSSDNLIDFSKIHESESSEICGVIEVCREDKSFFEDMEGGGLVDSSLDMPVREEQGSCSGKVENSGGEDCSPSVSGQRLDQSNAAMILTKCSGGPGQGTYTSQRMEGHGGSGRYLKKYSKRNWRWKWAGDTEDCQIIPYWQLSCSEEPKILFDAPCDPHEVSIDSSICTKGLSQCQS